MARRENRDSDDLDQDQHGNHLVFYSAVEPDALIAVLWHLLAFFVIRLPVTVKLS